MSLLFYNNNNNNNTTGTTAGRRWRKSVYESKYINVENFHAKALLGYFRVFAWCMKSSAIFSSCAACTNKTANPSHNTSAFFANINKTDVNRTDMGKYLRNMSSPSSRNQAKCKTFQSCENQFCLYENENHFHIKGFALSQTNQKWRNILDEKWKKKRWKSLVQNNLL